MKMQLIVTEKNIAAKKIASLLADGKPEAGEVYKTPVYRFKKDGQECVTIGLRGHIMGVDFPPELAYKGKGVWVALDEDGSVLDANIPDSFDTPPWDKKRQPYTADGILLI